MWDKIKETIQEWSMNWDMHDWIVLVLLILILWTSW